MNEPKIIFTHPEFLVIEKPAGLLVHGISGKKHVTRDTREATLVDWVLARYPEVSSVGDDPADRPGIVHRLDKETSGIILVARTQDAFAYLKSLFQKREIAKIYLAWVYGVPKAKSGVIRAPIGIRSGSVRRSTRSEKMTKEAFTEYRVLKTTNVENLGLTNYELREKNGELRKKNHKSLSIDHNSFSLLEVKPKTGRTHQIRVHLASIGHPVMGDMLYGGKRAKNRDLREKRMMLHALSIEFVWRDGARMHFETEMPKEFEGHRIRE